MKSEKFKLTRTEAAALCGFTVRHFNDSVRPYIPKQDVTGSGSSLRFWAPSVAHALASYRLASASGRAKDVDPAMIADADSPALERYRIARARLAEMEAEKVEGSHVAIAEISALCGRLAGVVRSASENLQKKFGPEISDTYNEAVTELINTWNSSAYGRRCPATDPGASTTDTQPKGQSHDYH